MNKFIAIDIGGTNIRVATIKNDQVTKKWTFKTNGNDVVASLAPVIEVINEVKAEYAGICMPGPADYERGIILNSPNLKGTWTEFDLKAHLQAKSTIKDAWFENDANVMALGNHLAYGLKESDISQFFTISTGLGAGLIYKNEIFVGTNHFAQEVAQVPIAIELAPTPLGVGALEYYASGSWIEKQARLLGYQVSTKEIFEQYQTNQDFKRIVNVGIDTMARTFAIVMAFMNALLINLVGNLKPPFFYNHS